MDQFWQGLLKERQITCIVNLHQLEVAKKYSTRIIGLSKGTIVFDGKPEELTDEVVEKNIRHKQCQFNWRGRK